MNDEYTHCKRGGKRIIVKTPGQEACYTGSVQSFEMLPLRGEVKKAPEKEQVCRVCGCTELLPCYGGCAWVKPDLCSACVTDKELMA